MSTPDTITVPAAVAVLRTPRGLHLLDRTERGALHLIRIAADGRLALTTATIWPGSILHTLEDAVGGSAERIPLAHGIDAWVNTEGFVLDLPPNPIGTAVCAAVTTAMPPALLTGPVVFCAQYDVAVIGTSPTESPSVLADAAGLNQAQQRTIIRAWGAAIPPVARLAPGDS